MLAVGTAVGVAGVGAYGVLSGDLYGATRGNVPSCYCSGIPTKFLAKRLNLPTESKASGTALQRVSWLG